MRLAGVKSNTCIDSSKEINEKYSKFEIGNIVRISKYKNIFGNGCTPNWSEKVSLIKKVKILCRRHMLLMIWMERKLWELFSKKNCKKQIKKSSKLKN